VWGALNTAAWLYAYFLIPETKGLSLEQVDRMMEETTPRTSAKWRPTTTFAADMDLIRDGHLKGNIIEKVEHSGTAE